MRKDTNKAENLRREGKSFREISKELNIPLSTLSLWFRDKKWSNEIGKHLRAKVTQSSKERLMDLNKIRGESLKKLYKQARNEAIAEFNKFKNDPVFIAGIVIYWGEGDKTSKNSFRIANTDPGMIKLFIDFLLNICKIDEHRLRAWILLYPDLDEEICKKFWIENTGLKDVHFTKSVIIFGRHKKRRVSNGVCNVSYSSTYLKEKMLVWIGLLAKI